VVPVWGFGGEVRLEHYLMAGVAVRAGLMGLYGPWGEFERTPGQFGVGVLALRVDLCGVLRPYAELEVRACQGVAGGGLSAAGKGFARSDHELVPWTAVANSVDATVTFQDGWGFHLGVEALVPLMRRTFVVRDSTEAIVDEHDLAPIGVALQAGPRLRF